MGYPLLLRAAAACVAALLAAGCTFGPGAKDPEHPDLACVSCHDGGLADSGLASVPKQTCVASDCHSDGGPSEVHLTTVTFSHRNHADTAVVRPSCAGCHSHAQGGEPLEASMDGCALCHVSEIDGPLSEGCQECHAQTRHVATTSQGLPLPHAGLPWVENTCVRCHYDVAAPETEVSVSRCQNCHTDPDSITARGMGTDLHPPHEGIACTSCHVAGTHRIFAMSSAVNLQCADCHAREHDVELTRHWPDAATCNGCHGTVHAGEQALMLGIVPGTSQPAPAYKFLRGLTCRGCHIRSEDAGAPATALRDPAGSCGSCHPPQYRRIVAWWREGARQRQQIADGYIARARTELGTGGGDSAQALLARADTVLDVLGHAGVQHNVELADRLYRDAMEFAAGALRAAGRAAPLRPDLGTLARPGFCSFCHFRVNEPLLARPMPADFHEQVIRGARS